MALLFFAVSVVVFGGINRWTSAGPPAGEAAIARDPQTPSHLFAAVGYSGVFESWTGGESWSLLHSFPTTQISAIAVDPSDADRIYLGANPGDVLRSVDGGTAVAQTSPWPGTAWSACA
ncbi:MAG TPA: hypothetical protein VMQ61_08070 [Thermoanaerobaculia bacterium]|nr:hypothetical protein [Thermoanaerobaculia bacterium]